MTVIIPISLKRLAVKRLADVQAGRLSKEQATQLLKRQARYSSRTREQLVESLADRYDPETGYREAVRRIGLITVISRSELV